MNKCRRPTIGPYSKWDPSHTHCITITPIIDMCGTISGQTLCSCGWTSVYCAFTMKVCYMMWGHHFSKLSLIQEATAEFGSISVEKYFSK